MAKLTIEEQIADHEFDRVMEVKRQEAAGRAQSQSVSRSMKTAMLEIIENMFLGENPHEAVFTVLNLEDGSTAPLGHFFRVAVRNRDDAIAWASANAIRIVDR